MTKKRRFKASHLELRYNTYFATLSVPKDVQHIIGKTKFYESTQTHDLRIAQAEASLKVIKWKAAIAEARSKTDDPILNSALELNRLMKTRSSPKHLVQDVIEEETLRIEHEVGPLVSENFAQVAHGKTKVLKLMLDDWKEYQKRRTLKTKTIDQMVSDVELMVSYLTTTHVLTAEHATKWIRLIAKKGNLTASSVTRIIGSCRNFFKYLQDVDVVSETAEQPFNVPKEFKISKSAHEKAINKTESWEPFEPQQVAELYKQAKRIEDITLANLIFIAAYSGARIEELCSLKKEHVNLSTKSMKIVDAKTKSGEREIPIHSAILRLINSLMNSSEDKEYLLPNLGKDKYDRRSNGVGKRFTRLKTSLGYGKVHVFHSIRKTFTTALENAGVAENITADIVGHKKQTMTYGLYSGGTTLEVKREAIDKLKYEVKWS